MSIYISLHIDGCICMYIYVYTLISIHLWFLCVCSCSCSLALSTEKSGKQQHPSTPSTASTHILAASYQSPRKPNQPGLLTEGWLQGWAGEVEGEPGVACAGNKEVLNKWWGLLAPRGSGDQIWGKVNLKVKRTVTILTHCLTQETLHHAALSKWTHKLEV